MSTNNVKAMVGFNNKKFVNGSGKLVDLDSLSKKRQKEIILREALKMKNSMLQAYETINKSVQTRKKIDKAIKQSELGKKRSDLQNEISSSRKQIMDGRKILETMAMTAGLLGVDVVADIDKLQLIEGGDE